MNKNILPLEFKTWIEFLDHIKKRSPEVLLQKENEFIYIKFNIGYKIRYSIEIKFLYEQAWNEINDYRLTQDELYSIMNALDPYVYAREKTIKLLHALVKDKIH